MNFYLVTRWGDSEDSPTEARMREVLAELDSPDSEHPDTWLSHESGWTLSIFESGLVVWENSEESVNPRHQLGISREAALRLWLHLSRGELNEIESQTWHGGYGPPLSDDEKVRRQREAAEITLAAQREFYNSLGPEDTSKVCRHEGCKRGTVKFSVFCRTHHFENLYKQPCPFQS